MIKGINNTTVNNNNIQFKGVAQLAAQSAVEAANQIKEFKGTTKFLDKFLKSQENLSSTRFIQGTLTNWFPKAVFSRSFIDFSEFTFLETLESCIFYFAAPLLGEHIFRNGLFKSVQPQKAQKIVAKNLSSSLDKIKKSGLDKELKNRLTTTKAGIVLACITVPAMEYALGFAKNLFTLKVFNVGDFNKVANLDKKKSDDTEKKNRIEKHSKRVLLQTGLLSLGGIAAGLALASKGHNSNIARKFSEALLEPGEQISKLLHKAGVKSEKADNFLKDYLKLDFSDNNGKLALSKGQLALTCITGLFGYSSAAKDRGKLDFYEVWTRVPLVVLYTIFGSALLDGSFKKILARKGKFPELIKQNENGSIAKVPSRAELSQIAQKISTANKTSYQKELETLIKQKSVITGVPYLFSLVAMGFILSGVSRIWTKYRYDHQQKPVVAENAHLKQYIKNPHFSRFNMAGLQ